MASYLTAKLVGEGFAAPDGDKTLPIDVPYAKLSEWLVDRKQVPSDWNRKLQAIQAKAAEAVRQLPPGFLSQFEGGDEAAVDYFLARQVLAKLEETAEKSLLGSLKGAAGDWHKIVRAYEYNLIYVAEAAQTLSRNADYEAPFFKKQAAKYQQQLSDLERRKADAHKSAAAAAAEYEQECIAHGISGGDIRGGLLSLTADLPALVVDAVEALQAEGVSQGLQYYSAVATSQQGQQQAADAAVPAGTAPQLLPVLCEVRDGRTEPPAAAAGLAQEQEAGQPPAAAAGGSGRGPELEWDLGADLEALEAAAGDRSVPGDAAAGISWDLDAADMAVAGSEAAGADEAAAGVISWDVEVEAAEEGGQDVEAAPTDSSTGAADVSWDIGISGEGEDSSQKAAAPAHAASAASKAAVVAAADESATTRRLIGDAGYRAQLLDDLFELRAFLRQRLQELSGRSSALLMAAAAQQAEQHIGTDTAAAMLAAVDAALAKLSGDKLKQLIALRISSRYLDRLVTRLQQKGAQEAKFLRAAADAEQSRGEVQRQLMTDSAKLSLLVKQTRQAKEEVERTLSAKLGQRINVMGELV
ncbi:CDK5RAP3-like protein [Chlorella vulgaris]